MRLMFLVTFSAGVSFLLTGCSSHQDAAIDLPADKEIESADSPIVADQLKQEKEGFVFRARYYRTKGPCIRVGNALEMPAIDAFTVVEVVKGDFKARSITVRALTGGGPDYPKELVEGKVYTLRLTPSERTKQQLREHEKEGYSYLVIDGDELMEQKIDK